MVAAVVTTNLPDLPLLRRGKVRDTYDLGDKLLMIATDRLSAFDVVLPTPIPGKGIMLTGFAEFWFAQTAGLVPNHLITTDPTAFPDPARRHAEQLAGRSMLVRRAERIDVECVVRGYLAGSAWAEYQASGRVAGEALPAGLRIGDRLPEPIFTPAIKVEDGHDVNVSREDVATTHGAELAERLELVSLNLYLAASALAEERHVILADTKFEFGFVDGELTVIDELLTPDSSRYWDATRWEPGRSPASFDKQFVRDWLAASGWDKKPPGPELPPEIVAGTRERYIEAYRRLTQAEPAFFSSDAAGTGATEKERVAESGSRWRVEVSVVPKAGVNDPEGEAILGGLRSLGFEDVDRVRAGRLFTLELEAASEAAAAARATVMAERLLANPVIQSFAVERIERTGPVQ